MAFRYVPNPPVIEGWFHQTTQPNRVLQDQLQANVPFRPALWDQHFDDSAFWVQKSYPIPQGYIPPFVPKPTFWKYNNDDYPYWLRQSYPLPPLRMPVGGGFPFKPQQWKRDYDEYSLYTVKTRQIPLVARPNNFTPIVPHRWLFDYNDASHWMPPRQQRPAGPPLYAEFVYATILGN